MELKEDSLMVAREDNATKNDSVGVSGSVLTRDFKTDSGGCSFIVIMLVDLRLWLLPHCETQ